MRYISIVIVFLFTIISNSFGQVRPDLLSFNASQRTTLVNLMQEYIDTTIIHWHCDFRNITGNSDLQIHDDFNFLPFHRAYMEGMEDFLILNGHPEFVPLPYWDPIDPTPSEFRLVDADCLDTHCTINVSGSASNYCDDDIDWTPNIDRSDYSELDDLCDYDYSPPSPPPVPWNDDEDELSRTLETPYHNDVHEEMGENMFSFASPASPIFWSWHAYLDDMWKDWECNCPQSTVADVDLYLKDNTKIMMHTRDVGEEPNIGPILESGDIWVRNQQDGFTNYTHEIPEYISPTTPVYVYVRIRNRGCQSSTGNETLQLHWAKGATALTWPSFWNGTTTTPALMGDLISTQNIPVTVAQGSSILQFTWFPPNPNDYSGINSDPDLFSLLARQVSTNDPMTFTEVADIEDNIRDNNNIASKNTNIIENTALPIELSYFLGKKIREDVQLSWQTDSEIKNKGFEIYRKSNNRSWENIGWVAGNGTSTQQHTYTFDDTNPDYGINYYRLKQIDFDGSYEYSEIVAVENNKSDFEIQVYPNPSSRSFNIKINNPLSQKMKVQINNNLGMKVWESNLITEESNWKKELNIEKNGIYIITVQLGSEIHYERIVIIGKE